MFGRITHQSRSTLRLLLFLFGLLQIVWASNRPIRDEQQRSIIKDIFSPTSPALNPPPPTSQLHENLKRQTGFEPLKNLTNGNAHNMNIQFGEAQFWAFSRRELLSEPEYLTSLKSKDGQKRTDLRKRQKDNGKPLNRTVYISFNTCEQPQPTNSSLGMQVPQLELYVSTNRRNTRPGPKVTNLPQTVILIDEGLGTIQMQADDEFYLGVYAPNVNDTDQKGLWTGEWNYELAASTKSLVHQKINDQNLFLIDTDTNSALLISNNLTDSADVEITKPPLEIFSYAAMEWSRGQGIENSYCAIRRFKQGAGGAVKASITKRGPGGMPRQQFLMTSLNKTTNYRVFVTKKGVAEEGNSPGGGMVWRAVSIATKSDGNCQVIFDLDFCSEVAYAVPSNPTIFPEYSQLAKFYDDIALAWYKNFSTSLQQIPCNATNDSKYSLAKTCDDCANDYKTWLCAVTIPRCADFSEANTYMQPRGIGTRFYNKTSGEEVENEEAEDFMGRTPKENLPSYQSRNPKIDEIIKPGPYKEVKPCIDLCYSMVQSCPTNFGFSCPAEGTFGALNSYGVRSDNVDGQIKCSYLGAAYNLAGVEGLFSRLSWMRLGVFVGAASMLLAGVL